MAMRTFVYDKLCRDKTKERHERHGSLVHTKELSDEAYLKALHDKLLEETQEVMDATGKADITEEIADVYEVLDALLRLHDIEKKDVLCMQEEKRAERGGFFERQYITHAEHPAESDTTAYCLAHPEKYPEIK